MLLQGATGMVGRTMLDVLEARDFPVARLLPVASSRSVGKTVHFKERRSRSCPSKMPWPKPLVALFSAGGIEHRGRPSLRL